MEVLIVEAEYFLADGRTTDRHEEANFVFRNSAKMFDNELAILKFDFARAVMQRVF
jgi:hypothetical protein